MTTAKRTTPASTAASPKATVGQSVGYVRVSSVDRNDARQLDGIALNKTFTDKASGKDTKRPQLQAMLAHVRAGDHVYVHSMDRLARSLSDLEGIVKGLTGRGVAVTFTGDDSPMNTLMLQLLEAVGQFERGLILERQREGIAIAKTKGVYKSRKPSLDDAGKAELRALVAQGMPKAQIAARLGISRTALYANL